MKDIDALEYIFRRINPRLDQLCEMLLGLSSDLESMHKDIIQIKDRFTKMNIEWKQIYQEDIKKVQT